MYDVWHEIWMSFFLVSILYISRILAYFLVLLTRNVYFTHTFSRLQRCWAIRTQQKDLVQDLKLSLELVLVDRSDTLQFLEMDWLRDALSGTALQ